ncbi:MAG: hypothetical protein GY778_16490 [bacterium]|nr:hypothetical protein [bacterium]
MTEPGTTRRTFLKATGAALVGGLTSSAGDRQGGDQPGRKDTAQVPPADLNGLLAAQEAVFRPTASGCTVQWVPNGLVEARVLAGPERSGLTLVRELASADATEVIVGGSPSDSDLYWQCQFRRPGDHDWIDRPVRRMHTARPAGTEFRVALIADSHINAVASVATAAENLRRANAAVLADHPDFVVLLGDEACVKKVSAAADANERWRSWRGWFAELVGQIPSFLTIGNHEREHSFQPLPGRSKEIDTHLAQAGATIARKRYYLNPLPDTHPEGGENSAWAGKRASEGNRSPLQNYFAWTWGDALFVVLDVQRYTNEGGMKPGTPEEWSLGRAQLEWLEGTLASSGARWKFVMGHHVVGGWKWDASGMKPNTRYAYGRGGARYARVGEQARITEIMQCNGASFFLYGHDHVFSHQQAEGINFICCGRPTHWLKEVPWRSPGWQEAYGDPDARDPHDFYAAIGYTRLTISPERVSVEYLRTGADLHHRENVSQQEGEVVYSFILPHGA